MTKLNGFILSNQDKLKAFYDKISIKEAPPSESISVGDNVYRPCLANIYYQVFTNIIHTNIIETLFFNANYSVLYLYIINLFILFHSWLKHMLKSPPYLVTSLKNAWCVYCKIINLNF